MNAGLHKIPIRHNQPVIDETGFGLVLLHDAVECASLIEVQRRPRRARKELPGKSKILLDGRLHRDDSVSSVFQSVPALSGSLISTGISSLLRSASAARWPMPFLS